MPEPKQLTEEDLKNMSPEEIKELAKKQCIFCQIVAGKVSSKKVYEDDYCIVILDINPANPGHCLITPKEHYSLMPTIPDDVTAHLSQVTKHISQALLKALKVQGTYVFIANGVAAGQKAQHFMIHVIPRKEGDGLSLDIPENSIQERQLEQIRSVLVAKIGETLGGFKPEAGAEEIAEGPKKKPIVEAEFEEKKEEKKEEKEKKLDLDAISALVTAKGIKEKPVVRMQKKTRERKKRQKKRLVSSSTSERYHITNCPFARRIKAKKRTYFKNRAEAKKHKKRPCSCVS